MEVDSKMNIGYKCGPPPKGTDKIKNDMECFLSLLKNGWYSDELEEMARITFKDLGKAFNIKPPVAKVDWDSMPDRRGIGA